MTAETDIADVDDGGANTAAEVRTALTSVLARADKVGASVRSTAVQTITSGSETAVEFDAERFDDSGFHDNAVNNTRLTIPTDGLYLVGGGGRLSLTGTARVIHRIGIDGTDTEPQGEGHGGNGQFPGDVVTILRRFTATQYVELLILHTRGADQDTLPETYGLWIVKLG